MGRSFTFENAYLCTIIGIFYCIHQQIIDDLMNFLPVEVKQENSVSLWSAKRAMRYCNGHATSGEAKKKATQHSAKWLEKNGLMKDIKSLFYEMTSDAKGWTVEDLITSDERDKSSENP